MIDENDAFDTDPTDPNSAGETSEEKAGDDMISDEDLDGAAGGAAVIEC